MEDQWVLPGQGEPDGGGCESVPPLPLPGQPPPTVIGAPLNPLTSLQRQMAARLKEHERMLLEEMRMAGPEDHQEPLRRLMRGAGRCG